MVPFFTSNSQAPSATSLDWTNKQIAKDPKGYIEWLYSNPETSVIAPKLEEVIRQQYPHAFALDGTNPPLVIRGLDSQNDEGQQIIGCDYLSVTGSTERLQPLRDLLQHYYPGLELQLSSGRHGYALGERSDLGVQLNYTPQGHEGGVNHGKVTLVLSGTALAALSRENKLRLMQDLNLMCFSPSRLDLKIRDFDNLITPFQLNELRQKSTDKGAEVSGFKKGNFVLSPTNMGEKAEDGTLYLGRRTGSKMIRVYSAQEKHGVNATDWELEIKDEKAKRAWRLIIDSYGESKDISSAYKTMASILVSSVNFVHRTDKNINRCEEYDFWNQIKKGLETVTLATVKVATTIQKTKKWVKKSVAASLATVVFHGLGVTTSELKEKGFEKVLEERIDTTKTYLYNMLKEVELKTSHIDRLSAAETRAQATDFFSPLFQT